MNAATNAIVYQLGSGILLFEAVGLLALAIMLGFAQSQRVRKSRRVLEIVAITFAVVSAAPSPWWLYTLIAVSLVACEVAFIARSHSRRVQFVFAGTCVATLGLAVGMEIPWQREHRLEVPTEPSTLFVIGDSVSAGMQEREAIPWPEQLKAKTHWNVVNLARMGATVKSAREQAALVPADSGIVIVEIGGNDILGSTRGSTPYRDFETDLDALLTELRPKAKVLLVFEIPLPPFCNRYGQIQRSLVTKHGAMVIPKRVLMRVLTTTDATIDSVHLTNRGHELLAAEVEAIVAPAMGR